MTDLQRFFKHSTIYAVGNLLNRIGAFVLLPIYTNYLTVAEYGTIEIFSILVSIVSGVLAIGIAHATLRFYFDFDDQDERNASVSTNYIGSLVISLVGVSLIALFANPLTGFVFDDAALEIGIYIVLATLVFELSSQICLAYIRAIEYSMFFVVISLAKLIIQVSVNSYLLVVEDAGVIGVLFGNMVTVIVGWLVVSAFTLRRVGFRFHWHKFVPVIKYSYPFLLSTVMALSASNADKIILNQMISLEALGIYALALKFHMIISEMIGEPFSKSYGAFRYTIMNNENAGVLQADIVRYLFLFSVFCALGMALFVSDLLHFMSHEDFRRAADLVPIIMIASIFKLMRYPAETGILYAKKTKYIFYFTTVAAVVSPVANILLIGVIGLYGACVSMVITESVRLYLMNHYSQKYLTVDYAHGKMLLAGSVAIALYLLSMSLSELPQATLFAVKVLLLAVFAMFVFVAPTLSREETARLREFIRARLRKRSA